MVPTAGVMDQDTPDQQTPTLHWPETLALNHIDWPEARDAETGVTATDPARDSLGFAKRHRNKQINSTGILYLAGILVFCPYE
jgi:hypothetical protein